VGIIARLKDISAGHSRAMHEGYAGMERYISEKRKAARSRPTS
jgi:hypothetical protein